MPRHGMTDAEWELIADLFPEPAATGRPPREPRELLHAIFWIVRTGAPWRDVVVQPCCTLVRPAWSPPLASTRLSLVHFEIRTFIRRYADTLRRFSIRQQVSALALDGQGARKIKQLLENGVNMAA